MFLIDDLLLAPGKAMLFVVSEVSKKAKEEWLDDAGIKQELRDLYLRLENGRIGEAEFDARERLLVTRLEEITRLKSALR